MASWQPQLGQATDAWRGIAGTGLDHSVISPPGCEAGVWLYSGTGKEVASAVPGSNGEVQQLPSRLPSAEPQTQAQSQQQPSNASPQRSLSPQPGPQPLAWLPATTAALALRLYSLDAALMYLGSSSPARDSLQVRSDVWLCISWQ